MSKRTRKLAQGASITCVPDGFANRVDALLIYSWPTGRSNVRTFYGALWTPTSTIKSRKSLPSTPGRSAYEAANQMAWDFVTTETRAHWETVAKAAREWKE